MGSVAALNYANNDSITDILNVECYKTHKSWKTVCQLAFSTESPIAKRRAQQNH